MGNSIPRITKSPKIFSSLLLNLSRLQSIRPSVRCLVPLWSTSIDSATPRAIIWRWSLFAVRRSASPSIAGSLKRVSGLREMRPFAEMSDILRRVYVMLSARRERRGDDYIRGRRRGKSRGQREERFPHINHALDYDDVFSRSPVRAPICVQRDDRGAELMESLFILMAPGRYRFGKLIK